MTIPASAGVRSALLLATDGCDTRHNLRTESHGMVTVTMPVSGRGSFYGGRAGCSRECAAYSWSCGTGMNGDMSIEGHDGLSRPSRYSWQRRRTVVVGR